MDRDMAPPRRRRLGGHSMLLRRRRIFAWLRDGLTYDEIAAEEGVSRERIRQIVSEVLQKRAVDSGADHAKLQLDRLMPAMQLAAEAISAGHVSAISSYLKVIDRLDRYQSVAIASEEYDGEARRKLLEKLNRLAANLGVGQGQAGGGRRACEHDRGGRRRNRAPRRRAAGGAGRAATGGTRRLRGGRLAWSFPAAGGRGRSGIHGTPIAAPRLGLLPAWSSPDTIRRGRRECRGRPAGSRFWTPWRTTGQASGGGGKFFYFFARNPLKSPNSTK